MTPNRHLALALLALLPAAAAARPAAGQDHAPSSSLLADALQAGRARAAADGKARTGAAATSLFHVAEPEPRDFRKHDLVQIVVVESSRTTRSQALETDKEFDITGEIADWPHLSLSDLLQLQLRAGNTTALPKLDVSLTKEFQGEGDYERKDDLTARLTAEVIEILPNGNLILEARTEIRTDQENAVMKVTGICRPDDVTAANTVLSHQVHDLKIERDHAGELKKSTQKGIIAQFFDFLFAW